MKKVIFILYIDNNYIQSNKYFHMIIDYYLTLNRPGGGGLLHLPLFLCPSTLVFETIILLFVKNNMIFTFF